MCRGHCGGVRRRHIGNGHSNLSDRRGMGLSRDVVISPWIVLTDVLYISCLVKTSYCRYRESIEKRFKPSAKVAESLTCLSCQRNGQFRRA
jgi:hypothetical protein